MLPVSSRFSSRAGVRLGRSRVRTENEANLSGSVRMQMNRLRNQLKPELADKVLTQRHTISAEMWDVLQSCANLFTDRAVLDARMKERERAASAAANAAHASESLLPMLPESVVRKLSSLTRQKRGTSQMWTLEEDGRPPTAPRWCRAAPSAWTPWLRLRLRRALTASAKRVFARRSPSNESARHAGSRFHRTGLCVLTSASPTRPARSRSRAAHFAPWTTALLLRVTCGRAGVAPSTTRRLQKGAWCVRRGGRPLICG